MNACPTLHRLEIEHSPKESTNLVNHALIVLMLSGILNFTYSVLNSQDIAKQILKKPIGKVLYIFILGQSVSPSQNY